jgi:hypothetical protein
MGPIINTGSTDYATDEAAAAAVRAAILGQDPFFFI